MGSIPAQVDQLVPFIKNRDGTGMCPFEKMLENVTSPEKAYEILTENIQVGPKTLRQAVVDPLTGRDITGDYVSESKKNMDKKLEKLFNEAEKTDIKPEDKKSFYSFYSNKISMVVNDYFRSIKQPVDEKTLNENLEKLGKIIGIGND